MVEEGKVRGGALRWQDWEDEILREIWTQRTPLKVSVARLPGRSVRGVQTRAAVLGLPRRRQARGTSETRPAFVRLRSELHKRRGTRMQLAARAGVTNQTAGEFIRHFRAQMHVVDWYQPADGRAAPIFKAGAGIDRPPPPKKPRAKVYSDYWKRMKRDRPDMAAARIARATFRRQEREGKFLKRDPAAVALFGDSGGAQ